MMKLERFKEENKKKKSILLFTVCCVLLIVGVFFYQSFALFETKENFNFIEGQVQDPGDLYFAYYIDDVLTYEMPSKGSGLTLSSKSSCTNGVTIEWDDEKWMAKVYYENYQKENNSRVKCTLYFEEKPVPPAVAVKDYILSKASADEIIEDDGTEDHNLRYIGKSPNNLVTFNNESWQIIGLMNNIDDGTGKKETRIKIVRNSSIGNYSWDTSDESVNSGYGVNEWSQADLMKLLNPGYESEDIGGSLYWDRGSGTCYNGKNNATTPCDFTSTGLSDEAKKYIKDVMWYTGGNGNNLDSKQITTSRFYKMERGTDTGKACSGPQHCTDTVERTTTWVGKVALIYPSDYGYAVGSVGSSLTRDGCLARFLSDTVYWGSSYNCQYQNWLKTTGSFFLNPAYTYDATYSYYYATNVYSQHNYGYVLGSRAAYSAYPIYPTLFLDSNVKIASGSGASADPFILTLE